MGIVCGNSDAAMDRLSQVFAPRIGWLEKLSVR